MTDFGPHPGLDSDGDYDPAQDLWNEANASCYSLPAWSKSPVQMINEARSMNQSAFASAAAAAPKHDNPPNHPWERNT